MSGVRLAAYQLAAYRGADAPSIFCTTGVIANSSIDHRDSISKCSEQSMNLDGHW